MTDRQLVRQAEHRGFRFDVGSDHHFDLNVNPRDVATLIKAQRQRTTLILPGDLFETTEGQDSSELVVQTLNDLVIQDGYERVIWVPGNHDARSQEKPFDRDPNLSDRILTPKSALQPSIFDLQGVRMMVANLMFHDLILPEVALTTKEAVNDLYRVSTDGKYLLGGDRSLFPQMGNMVRKLLVEEGVDVLITHVPPHPFLGKIIAEKPDEKTIEAERHGLGVIYGEEARRLWEKSQRRWQKAHRRLLPFEDYARLYWNPETVLLGTNVLSGTDFKHGLLSVSGHTHRSIDAEYVVDGKEVRFLSYQPGPPSH